MHALMRLGRDESESHRQSIAPPVVQCSIPLQAACQLQTTAVNAMTASAQRRRGDVRAEILKPVQRTRCNRKAFLNCSSENHTAFFFSPPELQ